MKPFVRLSDAPILSTSIATIIIIVIISYSIPFASTVLLTLYSVHLDQASLFCTRVLLSFVQVCHAFDDIWNHFVRREIHDQVNQARFTTALLGKEQKRRKRMTRALGFKAGRLRLTVPPINDNFCAGNLSWSPWLVLWLSSEG